MVNPPLHKRIVCEWLWCLAVLTAFYQVSTLPITTPVYKQHADHDERIIIAVNPKCHIDDFDGPPPCREFTFLDQGCCRWCPKCPAGHGQKPTPELDCDCDMCKHNTYQHSDQRRCVPCTLCAYGREEKEHCTPFSNKKCSLCPPGFYRYLEKWERKSQFNLNEAECHDCKDDPQHEDCQRTVPMPVTNTTTATTSAITTTITTTSKQRSNITMLVTNTTTTIMSATTSKQRSKKETDDILKIVAVSVFLVLFVGSLIVAVFILVRFIKKENEVISDKEEVEIPNGENECDGLLVSRDTLDSLVSLDVLNSDPPSSTTEKNPQFQDDDSLMTESGEDSTTHDHEGLTLTPQGTWSSCDSHNVQTPIQRQSSNKSNHSAVNPAFVEPPDSSGGQCLRGPFSVGQYPIQEQGKDPSDHIGVPPVSQDDQTDTKTI